MKLFDLHTHTTLSDGRLPVEDVVKIAKEKNVGLGISDHIFIGKITDEEKIRDYLKTLEQYDVLKGAEGNIGEDPKMADSLADQFDYIISSVHAVFEGNERIPLSHYFGYRCGHLSEYTPNYKKENAKKYLEQILKGAEYSMKNTRVDIYGHSTVTPFYDALVNTQYLSDWEDELLNLCAKYQVAIEISNLWKHPALHFINKAKKRNLKFSFGSDCHRLEETCDLSYCYEMIKEASITEDMMFVPKAATIYQNK